MKLFKTSLATMLLGLFIVGLTSNVEAQDKRQAVKLYNQALELVNSGDYQQAISTFEQAINEAEKLGEAGQDIKQRAQKQLPTTYYQIALKNYKEFQSSKSISSLDATIEAFRQAGDIAEQYGNTQIAEKVPGVITQLMYNKSLLQYQQKNYEAALATLNQVIERNANYAQAYYQKGIVTKNMEGGSLDEALGYFDKAIQVAQQNNNSQLVNRAKEAAASELLYQGSQAVSNKEYSRGVTLLKRALEYNPDSASAYYRLSEAYNAQQQWQQAVTAANKAIELSNSGRADEAKNYFALGVAYQGLGQIADACEAFNNAAYGSFRDSAEHKMEYELKCENI